MKIYERIQLMRKMVGEQRQRLVPCGVRSRRAQVGARAQPARAAHVRVHRAAAQRARPAPAARARPGAPAAPAAPTAPTARLRAQRAQFQPECLGWTSHPDDTIRDQELNVTKFIINVLAHTKSTQSKQHHCEKY